MKIRCSGKQLRGGVSGAAGLTFLMYYSARVIVANCELKGKKKTVVTEQILPGNNFKRALIFQMLAHINNLGTALWKFDLLCGATLWYVYCLNISESATRIMCWDWLVGVTAVFSWDRVHGSQAEHILHEVYHLRFDVKWMYWCAHFMIAQDPHKIHKTCARLKINGKAVYHLT